MILIFYASEHFFVRKKVTIIFYLLSWTVQYGMYRVDCAQKVKENIFDVKLLITSLFMSKLTFYILLQDF